MCTAYALHSRALRRSANAPYTAAQMAHQELDRLVESAAPDEVVLAAWETGDVDVVRAWLEDGGRWGGVRNLDERVFIDTWPAGQPHSIQRRTLVSGTLLTVACKSEHPSPIAEMLLDAGADCNTQHLIDAIGSGNICAVRALVPRLDMDEGYGLWSPLHFACAGGTWGNQIVLPNQVEIVHALLEAGAPVNGRTRRLGGIHNRPYGMTPLMKAAQQGFTRLGVVKWLLHYGADIAAADGGHGAGTRGAAGSSTGKGCSSKGCGSKGSGGTAGSRRCVVCETASRRPASRGAGAQRQTVRQLLWMVRQC